MNGQKSAGMAGWYECLLESWLWFTFSFQVLASYINPGGIVPENFDSDDYEPAMENTVLPDIVPEMLIQSCLVPAVSSYLRNDSVLDMAR